MTGDADGRILQFLQEAKRNTDIAQEFWVANVAGTVIASTLPSLRGREVGDREWMQAARRGGGWVGSPAMQDLTGRAGMPIAFRCSELRSFQARGASSPCLMAKVVRSPGVRVCCGR